MENTNQFIRIGTFCEKCRQVMCICAKHQGLMWQLQNKPNPISEEDREKFKDIFKFLKDDTI